MHTNQFNMPFENLSESENENEKNSIRTNCEYKFSRDTKENAKGDLCGKSCEKDLHFCKTHRNTAQAKSYGKPTCQKVKRDGDKCGKKLHKDSNTFCVIHYRNSGNQGDSHQCKAMTKVKGTNDEKQCSKSAIKDSDYCRAHTKCQYDMGDKLCGKRTHKFSVQFCIEHDTEYKCKIDNCWEPKVEGKKGYCKIHYRQNVVKDICMWPITCERKPSSTSKNHYCGIHEKLSHRPQCKFITIDRNKMLTRCLDHVKSNGNFCEKHNKKLKIEKADEKMLNFGKAVALCMKNGTSEWKSSVAIHKLLGFQFAVETRLEQFQNAVASGECADIDDDENVIPIKKGKKSIKKVIESENDSENDVKNKKPVESENESNNDSENDSENDSDNSNNDVVEKTKKPIKNKKNKKVVESDNESNNDSDDDSDVKNKKHSKKEEKDVVESETENED